MTQFQTSDELFNHITGLSQSLSKKEQNLSWLNLGFTTFKFGMDCCKMCDCDDCRLCETQTATHTRRTSGVCNNQLTAQCCWYLGPTPRRPSLTPTSDLTEAKIQTAASLEQLPYLL